MMFDATGSDKLSWFSRDKLTGTLPWADIKGSSNYFSIKGDTGNSRRFFINKAYGGCPGDEGWMAIGGPNCDWERNFGNNAILYSKLSTATKWQTPPAYGELMQRLYNKQVDEDKVSKAKIYFPMATDTAPQFLKKMKLSS